MLAKFFGVEFLRLYQSSGKEKKSCLVFASSTKREFRHFHVVVVQRRQINERDARAKLLFQLLFCQSKAIVLLPLTAPSSMLKLPGMKDCPFMVEVDTYAGITL